MEKAEWEIIEGVKLLWIVKSKSEWTKEEDTLQMRDNDNEIA